MNLHRRIISCSSSPLKLEIVSFNKLQNRWVSGEIQTVRYLIWHVQTLLVPGKSVIAFHSCLTCFTSWFGFNCVEHAWLVLKSKKMQKSSRSFSCIQPATCLFWNLDGQSFLQREKLKQEGLWSDIAIDMVYQEVFIIIEQQNENSAETYESLEIFCKR